MYSTKSIELIVKPWQAIALPEYSWKIFTYKTTGDFLLLKNNEIRPNTAS